MSLSRIRLKKGAERRLLAGHLWVFSNEVETLEGSAPEPGAIVEVRRTDGAYLGWGLYHPHSLITVRLLGRGEPEELDCAFFRSRLEQAWAMRREFLEGQTNAYRVCFGESDGLPGVIVDRFSDTLAVQILSLGMAQREEALLDALEELFSPKAIVARYDSPLRQHEGLPIYRAVVRGRLEGPVEIEEHGLYYEIDVLEGQKTGFFLDQREHRRRIRAFAEGRRVLDVFCNEGGFTLNALAGGAYAVWAVDISEPALERLRRNLTRNGFASSCVETIRSDALDFLAGPMPAEGPFGLIILDPPSFTRSRKTVGSARRAYRHLNSRALSWLEPGGFLATASCSHHIYEETFLDILQESARALGRPVRILYRGYQPVDHPVLLGMPETRYLKFYVLQVL